MTNNRSHISKTNKANSINSILVEIIKIYQSKV